MKKIISILIVAILVVIVVGCEGKKTQVEEAKVEKVTVEDKTSNASKDEKGDQSGLSAEPKDGALPTSEPHSFPGFTKEGVFTGGEEVKNYTLTNIRRAPHPNFTRLILDFEATDKGVTASQPPQYEISYLDAESQLRISLTGIKENRLTSKIDEIKALAPIIEDIKFEESGAKLNISIELKEKVTYQMFSLSEPARIAIVLNPDKLLQQ